MTQRAVAMHSLNPTLGEFWLSNPQVSYSVERYICGATLLTVEDSTCTVERLILFITYHKGTIINFVGTNFSDLSKFSKLVHAKMTCNVI